MKKKDLISRWLDFNLNDDELETFQKLDVSNSYQKITDAARHFKAPDFDAASSYVSLHSKLPSRQKRYSIVKYVSAIAAVLIVCFGIFYFINSSSVEYLASNNSTTEFQLPDASKVILNDGSVISFDDSNWNENRKLKLEGEAYFIVSKGSKFTVITQQGEVSVMGTQFNVKDRPDYFEVSCFEGRVQVIHSGKVLELTAGDMFKAYGDKSIKEVTSAAKPEWLDEKSMFKSVPFNQVVEELERQYDIEISGDAKRDQTLFTGSFSHKNLETALQAITIPLNLSYTINGNIVVLKNNRQ